MKIRLSLLALAAAVVAVAGAMLVTPASGGSSVPFHASFQFTLTYAGNDVPPCVNAARFNVVGSGIATHLGRFDTVQYQCAPNDDPYSFTGKMFTGANGDTIYGSYGGRFVPIPGSDEFRPDAHWTIDGEAASPARPAAARWTGTRRWPAGW